MNSTTQNGYVLLFLRSPRHAAESNAPLSERYEHQERRLGSGGRGQRSHCHRHTRWSAGAGSGRQDLPPEDVNGNGFLDNFGAANLGLGFYGTVATPAKNLNPQINGGANPDRFGTGATTADDNNRIASCMNTGRKNWVSGARHVLRLVDGSPWATYRSVQGARSRIQEGSR